MASFSAASTLRRARWRWSIAPKRSEASTGARPDRLPAGLCRHLPHHHVLTLRDARRGSRLALRAMGLEDTVPLRRRPRFRLRDLLPPLRERVGIVGGERGLRSPSKVVV